MTTFIKQRLLGNRTTTDISQITKFGFVAWKFMTAIYESE